MRGGLLKRQRATRVWVYRWGVQVPKGVQMPQKCTQHNVLVDFVETCGADIQRFIINDGSMSSQIRTAAQLETSIQIEYDALYMFDNSCLREERPRMWYSWYCWMKHMLLEDRTA